MQVDLLGYSERGMVNALCYDLSINPSLLKKFLGWFEFRGRDSQPNLEHIQSATLLVEQSFSDFGDLDLLILLKHEDPTLRQAILIEAKVSNCTNSWQTIEDRWDEFLTILDGGEGSTSNLFVQLHRKVRLIESLKRNDGKIEPDILTVRAKIGENQIVKKAYKELKACVEKGNAFFAAILPDDSNALNSFATTTLHNQLFPATLPKWDLIGLGFLSWQTLFEKAQGDDWTTTKAAFEWNDGQIFRTVAPVQHSIGTGRVYMHNSKEVYVVSGGTGNSCGVVALEAIRLDYFCKPERVNVGDLSPCETPVSMINVPMLPRTGAICIWDSQGERPRLPSEVNPIDIATGTNVVVMNSSWFTTRVRKADSPKNIPSFLVFTHHLRRPNCDS